MTRNSIIITVIAITFAGCAVRQAAPTTPVVAEVTVEVGPITHFAKVGDTSVRLPAGFDLTYEDEGTVVANHPRFGTLTIERRTEGQLDEVPVTVTETEGQMTFIPVTCTESDELTLDNGRAIPEGIEYRATVSMRTRTWHWGGYTVTLTSDDLPNFESATSFAMAALPPNRPTR